jgi:hypothetical protein
MQGRRNKARLAVCCSGYLSFLPKKRLYRPARKRTRNAVDIERISSFFVADFSMTIPHRPAFGFQHCILSGENPRTSNRHDRGAVLEEWD